MIDAVWKDDPDFEEMEEMFLRGECAVFALALADETSLPIAAAFFLGHYDGKKSKKGELIHAVCVNGEDTIDFMGRSGRSLKDLALDYFEEAMGAGMLDERDRSPDLIFIEMPYPKELLKKRFVGTSADDIFEMAVRWIRQYPGFYR